MAEQLSSPRGVMMIVGASHSGKTTLARTLVENALRRGQTAAYIDCDLATGTVGPPACIGMKWLRSHTDLADLSGADDLRFVGGVRPDRLILQQASGVASLVASARARADLVVIDTSGLVAGIDGQWLKYHKANLVRPDIIWALQRGIELAPLVSLFNRFLTAEVITVPAGRTDIPMSPEEHRSACAAHLAAAFPAPLQRWRVLPTVFAPSLPAGFDLERLDRLLVGVHDPTGVCVSLGLLEYDGVLRVITSGNPDMGGLSMGSVRINPKTFHAQRVHLDELLFGIT